MPTPTVRVCSFSRSTCICSAASRWAMHGACLCGALGPRWAISYALFSLWPLHPRLSCSYAMCSMRHPLLFVPPTHHFLTHPGDGFGVGLNLHGLGAQGLLLWGSHLLDHHLYIVIAVLIGVVTGIVGHDRGDRSRWMGWHLFFPFLLVANPVLRHGHIPVLIVDACLWRVRGCAGVCPLCLWPPFT